jgi:hypothetical protein
MSFRTELVDSAFGSAEIGADPGRRENITRHDEKKSRNRVALIDYKRSNPRRDFIDLVDRNRMPASEVAHIDGN